MAKADYQLPNGYQIEFGGESAERNKAVGKLMASVGLILTLLLTVVVLSFNSFRLSAIIFLSAFQSIGLGLLSVYIFDYPFGFTVIIALLGLMGLAINAAIVIIAELKMDEKAIQGDRAAIIRCVQSCARHISSTTITTVGGFLPLILAGGGFWPPFAVAVAGGTVLTTLLSFIFVPAAFSLLSQRNAFELTKQPV
jgi:multidrug efflux pump subunit AcrB